MATHHASPGEVVDLRTWAQDAPGEDSKAIVKTDDMELARLAFAAGEVYPNHHVSGPIVLHAITGIVELTAMGAKRTLVPGQLLYLAPDEPYSLRAVTDAVVLLSIIFKCP